MAIEGSIKTFEQNEIDPRLVNHHQITVVEGPMGDLIGMKDLPTQPDAIAVIDVFDLCKNDHQNRVPEIIQDIVIPYVEKSIEQ